MGIFAELADDVLAVLKAAGKEIETFVMSEGQKLVASVKQTGLGTTALNIISALESHTATGTEKMEMLIAALVPALNSLEANGGLKGLVTSIEDFAREFAQSAYNDFKAAL